MAVELYRATRARIGIKGPEAILKKLWREYSFTNPNFYSKFKFVRMIERKEYFNKETETEEIKYFAPLGLLVPLRRKIKEFTGSYPTDNSGLGPPPIEIDGSFPGKIWDYNAEFLHKIIKYNRCFIHSKTNSGKTSIMLALSWYYKGGKKIIYLCSQKRLAKTEILEQFEEIFPGRVGLVGAGKKEIDKDILICIDKTLVRVMKDIKPADVGLILKDEADQLSAQQVKILSRFIESHIYGFSGSWIKDEESRIKRWKIIKYCGAVLRSPVEHKELEDRGISAAPEMYCIDVPYHDKPYRRPKDYYHWSICDNQYRNHVVAFVAAMMSPHCVVICRRYYHVEMIAEKLKSYGIKCEAIDGTLSTDKQTEALDRLKNGEIGVIITTPILDRGLNIPFVRVVVDATGGPSLTGLEQRKGRAARKKDVYNIFKLVIFNDLFHDKAYENSKKKLLYLKSQGRVLRALVKGVQTEKVDAAGSFN